MSIQVVVPGFNPPEPMCLLVVDGPNVQITEKNLWIENTEEGIFPEYAGIDYDAVAKAMQKKFNIAPENMEKVIFLKRQKDRQTEPNTPATYHNQERFKHAMKEKGWHVVVRAQAENTANGDKQNDIDDDLIAEADKFIAQAIENDVLLIMSGDFNTTPGSNSTVRTLTAASQLGLRVAAIAFEEQFTRNARSAPFELIDTREIEGAFEVKPPKARTVADLLPGDVGRFHRPDAPSVIGRRPSKTYPATKALQKHGGSEITPRLPDTVDLSGVDIPRPREVTK